MVPCTFGGTENPRPVEGATLDSEWDGTSRCECLICGWEGIVSEAETSIAARTRSATAAPASRTSGWSGPVDLDEIRGLLKRQPCPPLWKAHLAALTREVERLREVIEAMARISDREARPRRSAADEDTVVG
jgi:hypothetical protein